MTTHQGAHAVGSDRADPVKADSQALAEEQQYRAEAYRLIAALLRSAPDAPLLEKISGLSEVAAPDELGISLSMLGLAARSFDQRAAAEEFHQLFIGLGRGELVPYASWYLTGFLMEKPLGELREHLLSLGFERQAGIHEPEDHIAALCEVMSILIQEDCPHAEIARFYEAHLAPWVDRLFADLSQARAAVFYRNLGRFGAAFFELERRYFSMQI
ncbi:MAG: molecular chaperone TorD family protein [Chromatiaceae bacterium]|nr:molecular chaperone TorD family protein [Gammaproteobacteria bacterium]MCB1872879.1 molecular chaperone TorD family protein [Gammaproteobacteria bacterium]MCB1879861.1 molecular chaperone TorD family protein [Gammaproteobacteria bacterium]MCB1903531.1 molecular chaperone TorD family protein [Gammaproteobacteria bacterium]MCP5446435.1 molecular chaperone TorD family protein [Chromatiaceae bacterium]